MGRPGVDGRFGQFGGRYVPESLVPACQELAVAFDEAWSDPEYRARLTEILTSYGGRPTPVTECHRLSAQLGSGSFSSARTWPTPARTSSTTW